MSKSSAHDNGLFALALLQLATIQSQSLFAKHTSYEVWNVFKLWYVFLAVTLQQPC